MASPAKRRGKGGGGGGERGRRYRFSGHRLLGSHQCGKLASTSTWAGSRAALWPNGKAVLRRRWRDKGEACLGGLLAARMTHPPKKGRGRSRQLGRAKNQMVRMSCGLLWLEQQRAWDVEGGVADRSSYTAQRMHLHKLTHAHFSHATFRTHDIHTHTCRLGRTVASLILDAQDTS